MNLNDSKVSKPDAEGLDNKSEIKLENQELVKSEDPPENIASEIIEETDNTEEQKEKLTEEDSQKTNEIPADEKTSNIEEAEDEEL
ncbi:hypothetical protein ACFLTI_03575, partial [Bacteroidota bacterium]